jgi:ATP-dependent Zn protease
MDRSKADCVFFQFIAMSGYLTFGFSPNDFKKEEAELIWSIFLVTLITCADFQFILVLFFARQLNGRESSEDIMNVEDTLMLSATVSR